MSKMTRRSFAQFFGASMVGVSLAVFGTGLVSSKSAPALPGLDPLKSPTRKYVGPAVEGKWIGGESDTFNAWAKSWSLMSGRPNRFVEHDLRAEEVRHNVTMTESYKQNRINANWRLKVVDNVFKQDPLLAYLKKKSRAVSPLVLSPSRLADHAGVDISNFGPKE